MRIRIATGLLLTLTLMAGCGARSVTKIVTIELEAATPEQRLEATRILTERFDDYFGSLLTSVESKRDGNAIVFEFHGEPPDDALLRHIGSIQGILRLYPARSPAQLLMSERDIEDVTASLGQAGPVVAFQLTERAGQRLLAFTSRNLGSQLIMTLDREEISRANVNGVFGRRFETSGLDFTLAKTMHVVLKHGRLPVAVRNLDVRTPST